MYDALTGRYTFACPSRGETQITLSSFRRIERLPGAAHPAVFGIAFACGCGEEHLGLIAHDELDWAPLGLADGVFHNLMTSRLDDLAGELADVSARRIQAGEWPWSFYCLPEERPRPVFPSSFTLLAPGGSALGLAVQCPSCTRVTVNLVSPEHVDLPFHNDTQVGVVAHHFHGDPLSTVAEFREELYSASFDIRRLALE
jgi:hypothetical protein